MAKTLLTEAAVERMRKPQTGRTETSDAEPGLFLWITSNGTRSWVVIYRLPDVDGKRSARRKTVIGRHPAMGVIAAREAARNIMDLARQGIDPELQAEEDKVASEHAAVEKAAGSFRAVAEAYVAAMEAGKLVGGRARPVTAATAAGRKSLLDRLVLPSLGDKPLTEISPQLIARTLANIEKASGPVDETLKAIRGVFKFALSRGVFHGLLPTAGMTNRQPKVKETRALADEELKALWRAASGEGWPFGAIIRMLMLTGQRKNEIAAARWNEVDWERKLLTIPTARVKNRAGAHEVPLSEPALEILKEARKACDLLGNKSGLIFPSAAGDTPLSGWSKLKPTLDRAVRAEIVGLSEAEMRAVKANGPLRSETLARKAAALEKIKATKTPAWRIHDLRHTFITRCRDGEENAEGEVIWSAPLDVLQAVVNHEITAGVTATYDHGDIQRRYRLRKREVLDWWARKLMTMVGASQVET